MQSSARLMMPLLSVLVVAGCRRDTTRHDTAGSAEYTGGCVDFVTRPDGSITCAKVLEDLAEGWNCCSEANHTCTPGANTQSQKNPDGSSSVIVHCGKGYYPVFCQNSSIGLICSTTEQLP